MNRHDFLHVFVGNYHVVIAAALCRAGANRIAHGFEQSVDFALIPLPFREQCQIARLAHRLRQQAKRYVFGELDLRAHKSRIDLLCQLSIGNQAMALVRHDHKIERTRLANLGNRLKPRQLAGIVLKILGKLIPNEEDRRQRIRSNDVFDPVDQRPDIHAQKRHALFFGNGEYALHQFGHAFARSRFELLDDVVDVELSLPRVLFLRHLFAQKIAMVGVFEPSKRSIFERPFGAVFDTSLR